MNHINTYENFFSNLFKKKDDSDKNKDTKRDKKNTLSLDSFFNKKDDDLAKKVLLALNNSFLQKENSKIIGGVSRYADYKRSVKFQGSDGKLRTVTIEKSNHPRRFTTKTFLGVAPSETYTLVIDGRHFIDRKTNKSTVSQRVCKKIWDVLDKEHDKAWFDKENLSKSFE